MSTSRSVPQVQRSKTYHGPYSQKEEHESEVKKESGHTFAPKKAIVEVTAQADCRLRIPMKLEVDFRDLTIRPAGRWDLRCDCEAVSY